MAAGPLPAEALAVLAGPVGEAVAQAAGYAGQALAENTRRAYASDWRAWCELGGVAALPAAVGLAGADYRRPAVLTTGYRHAMVSSAVLLVLGGVVSWVGLRHVPTPDRDRETG